MRTNAKQLQGRHRAPAENRPARPAAALPVMLGAAAVVLGLLVAWQVL